MLLILQQNIKKHGLYFEDAKYIFENDYIEIPVMEKNEQRSPRIF